MQISPRAQQQQSRFHDTNSLRNSFYYYVTPASNFGYDNIHRGAFSEGSIPRDDQTSDYTIIRGADSDAAIADKTPLSPFPRSGRKRCKREIFRVSRISRYFPDHENIDEHQPWQPWEQKKELHLIIRRLSRTRCPR